MAKSFIKFRGIKPQSEKHNTREKEPKYLVKAERENLSISNFSVAEKRAELEKRYQEKVGQKMQKKMTPICLFALTDELEKRYGIKTFQWHIHNDEGHTKENGKTSYNYHAHIVCDWTDHNTGKSLKLTSEDMSEIQTLTSEVMGMERGEKGSKNLSLNHHEYRGFLTIKDELEKSLKMEISREKDRELRELIKQKAIEDKERQKEWIKQQKNDKSKTQDTSRDRGGYSL